MLLPQALQSLAVSPLLLLAVVPGFVLETSSCRPTWILFPTQWPSCSPHFIQASGGWWAAFGITTVIHAATGGRIGPVKFREIREI